MTKTLEFAFDYVSPTSYLAWTQLPGLLERTGATLLPLPVFLGGIMKAAGNTPPMNLDPRARWMEADMARFAARYGVPLRMNPAFPMNTITAMRGAVAALGRGELDRYSAALFPAVWADGLDISKPEVLHEVISAAGLDADALLAAAASGEAKVALRANTDSAAARGAFGAPTFFVNGEFFFGQDRLDFVEEALSR